jgi:hypothetical protein
MSNSEHIRKGHILFPGRWLAMCEEALPAARPAP